MQAVFVFGNRWVKAKAADAAIAFHVEETATNLLTALSFPAATLTAMAGDLHLTYAQIDHAANHRAKKDVLQSIAQFALAKRHEALNEELIQENIPCCPISV